VNLMGVGSGAGVRCAVWGEGLWLLNGPSPAAHPPPPPHWSVMDGYLTVPRPPPTPTPPLVGCVAGALWLLNAPVVTPPHIYFCL
jgi:hypothetical protein